MPDPKPTAGCGAHERAAGHDSLRTRLERRYDAWQVARVRRAYTSVSEQPSARAGYAGMVEEMTRGLAELDPAVRGEADRRVLRTIFFGTPGLWFLRRVFAWMPDRAARLMSRASPTALRFLVGQMHAQGRHGDRLVDCAFRREGGQELCEQICRRPTEAFARTHGMLVRLQPRQDSPGCDWTWG